MSALTVMPSSSFIEVPVQNSVPSNLPIAFDDSFLIMPSRSNALVLSKAFETCINTVMKSASIFSDPTAKVVSAVVVPVSDLRLATA